MVPKNTAVTRRFSESRHETSACFPQAVTWVTGPQQTLVSKTCSDELLLRGALFGSCFRTPSSDLLEPKGPSRTKKHYGTVNYYAVVFLLRPPNLIRRRPFFKRRDACNSQGKRCPHKEVAIVNHCVIVNLLCIVILLWRSIFSTAGSFGKGRRANFEKH